MGNTADILCTSLACTSGGKFQVRVATSGLIVKFSLMNNVFSNLTTLLQVVTTLTNNYIIL